MRTRMYIFWHQSKRVNDFYLLKKSFDSTIIITIVVVNWRSMRRVRTGKYLLRFNSYALVEK